MDALTQGRDGDTGRAKKCWAHVIPEVYQGITTHLHKPTRIFPSSRGGTASMQGALGGMQLARLSLGGLFRYPYGM